MYKRGLNDINILKKYEMYLYGGKKEYSSLAGDLNMYKPYHGLYIYLNKILVSSVIEKISYGDNIYRIANYADISRTLDTDEYLVEASSEDGYFVYDTGDILFFKKIQFIENSNILCIEYNIQNNGNVKAMFEAVPLVTYRKINVLKKSNMLKFPKLDFENGKGTKINLSVANSMDLVMLSDEAEFQSTDNYLMNIVHTGKMEENLSLNMVEWKEDLYVPRKV